VFGNSVYGDWFWLSDPGLQGPVKFVLSPGPPAGDVGVISRLSALPTVSEYPGVRVLNPSADRSQPLVSDRWRSASLDATTNYHAVAVPQPSGPRLSATDANRIKRKDVPQPFANGIVPEASCCKARALVRSCQRSNLMLSAASGFVSGHLRGVHA